MTNGAAMPVAGAVAQPGVVNAASRTAAIPAASARVGAVPGQAQPTRIAAGGKGDAIGAAATARAPAPPAQNAVGNAGLKTAAVPGRPAAAPPATPTAARPNGKPR